MNKTHNILISVLAILTLVSMTACAVSASTTISIASPTISTGSTITVPIMANNITNVAAYTISLTYNPAVVVVDSVGAGDLGGVTKVIDNVTGVTQMSAFSTTPVSGNVILANVALRAVGTAGQTSPLNITVTTLSDDGGNTIPADVNNGTFSIATKITTITVTPANESVTVGNITNFTATDQDGNVITTIVNWSSDNTSVGTIDSGTGVFTAVAPGIATITATNGSVSGSTTITVTSLPPPPPVLTTINVSPANSSVTVGNVTNFTAETLDQYGNPISAIITWSSDNTSVGTIDSGTGVFTAVAPGIATITATNGSVSGSTTITVTSLPSTSTTISIASQTVTPGSTVTVPIMANNITNVAAYTISLTYNPAIVVVDSVGAGALGGVTTVINNVTGVTQMSAFSTTPQSGNVILANVTLRAVGTAGQTSPLTLTVTTLSDNNGNTIPAIVNNGTFSIAKSPPVLTTINVAPANSSVTVGNTTTFIATPLDQYGNPISAIVIWNSSNTSVGKIDSFVYNLLNIFRLNKIKEIIKMRSDLVIRNWY